MPTTAQSILPSSIADPIVAKRVAPSLDRVRDLALRRGDGGLRSLVVALLRAARSSSGAASALPAAAAHPSAAPTLPMLRCGPEDVKSCFVNEGIPLTGLEVADLLQAFRDPVGYLLIGPLLDALVLDVLSPSRLQIVRGAFTALSATPAAASTINVVQLVAEGRRVSKQTILSLYKATSDPRVVVGCTTESRALHELIDALRLNENSGSSVLTELEWVAYQAAVAMLLPPNSNDAWLGAMASQWPPRGINIKNTAANTHAVAGGGARSTVGGSSVAPLKATAAASSVFSNTSLEASRSPRGKPVSEAERLRWSQKGTTATQGAEKKTMFGGEPESPHIVGYVGHIPTAVEHFGETFHATDVAVHQERSVTKQQLAVDQRLRETIGYNSSTAADRNGTLGEEEEAPMATVGQLTFNPRCPPITRQGNKANNHSFRMS